MALKSLRYFTKIFIDRNVKIEQNIVLNNKKAKPTVHYHRQRRWFAMLLSTNKYRQGILLIQKKSVAKHSFFVKYH